MRILIYGAGVIGSLYAALFAEAGYDTSIYARGKRLEFLKKNGLLYKKKQNIKRAEPTILGELPDNDIYDFVLLTVRENQLYEALAELKNNKSNIIVTMVNSLDSYKKWEDIVGKGRILPAGDEEAGEQTKASVCLDWRYAKRDAGGQPQYFKPISARAAWDVSREGQSGDAVFKPTRLCRFCGMPFLRYGDRVSALQRVPVTSQKRYGRRKAGVSLLRLYTAKSTPLSVLRFSFYRKFSGGDTAGSKPGAAYVSEGTYFAYGC